MERHNDAIESLREEMLKTILFEAQSFCVNNIKRVDAIFKYSSTQVSLNILASYPEQIDVVNKHLSMLLPMKIDTLPDATNVLSRSSETYKTTEEYQGFPLKADQYGLSSGEAIVVIHPVYTMQNFLPSPYYTKTDISIGTFYEIVGMAIFGNRHITITFKDNSSAHYISYDAIGTYGYTLDENFNTDSINMAHHFNSMLVVLTSEWISHIIDKILRIDYRRYDDTK